MKIGRETLRRMNFKVKVENGKLSLCQESRYSEDGFGRDVDKIVSKVTLES